MEAKDMAMVCCLAEATMGKATAYYPAVEATDTEKVCFQAEVKMDMATACSRQTRRMGSSTLGSQLEQWLQ